MTGLIWVLLAMLAVFIAIGLSMRWQKLFAAQPPLQTAFLIQNWQVVDLTHPLTPAIPIWSGDPTIEIQPWTTYDKEGYFVNRLAIGEHSGTHWGTPNTFIPNAKSADQFTAQELVVPAVVIDIQTQATDNPDYCLSLADIQSWEAVYGQIPANHFVILFTGWQNRWADPISFFNADAQEVYHFPGFGAEAAEFLVTQRKVIGLGTDTHGADPGNDENYGASAAIYQANGMILECLAGLDRLPAIGATLVIGGLPIQGGSGSPARVMALVPKA